MTDVLLPAALTGDEAIVPGADNADAVNAALARIARAHRTAETTRVVVRGTIHHDRTIELRDAVGVRLVPEKKGNGFQTLTDTGGLEPRQARIRVHVRIEGGEDSGLCELLDVGGTHPDDGPNASPDDPDAAPGDPRRDIWEGQALVQLAGTRRAVVQANLHNGWGDFVETTFRYDESRRRVGCEDTILYAGRWSRNGRVAVKAHWNRGLRWFGTDVRRCTGGRLHIESVGTDPAGDQADIEAWDITTDSSGRMFVNVTGKTALAGLYVHGIFSRGKPVQVKVDGPARPLGAVGPAAISRVRLEHLLWDEPEDGGPIAEIRNVDGVEYGRGCVGPVRSVGDPRKQFQFRYLRDVWTDLSGITRV